MQRDWQKKADAVQLGDLVAHDASKSVGLLVGERLTPIFREAKATLRLADGTTTEVDRALLKPATDEQRVAYFSHPSFGGSSIAAHQLDDRRPPL